MKIAVVEFAGKGGLIHYAFQLCRAMSAEGADVTLITDRNYELESLTAPFEVERALNLWDPKPGSHTTPALIRKARRATRAARYYREWFRVRGLVRKMNPDVVQLGDLRFATDLAPILALRRSSRVLADICHNVQPFSGGEGSSGTFAMSSLERSLYRRTYAAFDEIFVHYEVNAREFGRTFPELSSRTTTIVHGNEEIFRELDGGATADSLRADLRMTAKQKVVLFFGTLSRYKGLDILLDAFSLVHARVPEAVLVVAGFPFSDFDVDAYRREAERRGLAERIRIVPRYVASSEVAAWMSLADVIVFPYRNVFQSGALHVAHTFGVPIVATNVGAMSEVVRNRESGIVVAPRDVDAIAGAIVELLLDRVLATRFGAAASNDAATNYSWRSVARTILQRYEQALARRGR